MNKLTEYETKLVDEFILTYLQNINKSLNRPSNEFGPEHFYHIISFFPTWRQEELANINDKSTERSDYAYKQYIEALNEQKY